MTRSLHCGASTDPAHACRSGPKSRKRESMNSLGDFLWAMIAFYFIFMCIWIFIRIFADIFRRQDMTGVMKVLWILVLFWIPFFGAMVYIIARPKDAPSELFAP